jgi:hypothetical protein
MLTFVLQMLTTFCLTNLVLGLVIVGWELATMPRMGRQ